MASQGSTILVIGGTGFIGERVVERLARGENNRVLVVHVNPLQDVPPSPALYFRALADQGEHLRSLLAESDTVLILSQPEAQMVTQVLAEIPRGQSKKILYASTALLYRGGSRPQREDDELDPITPYEKDKLAEEKLLEEFCATNASVRVTVTRLGNVYGSPKNRGVVGKVFDSLFKGGSITLVGGGRAIRDYTFVDDVAEALAHLAVRPQQASFEVFNVTTGVGYALRDVIKKIEELSGKKLKWQEGPVATETESIIGHSGKLARLVSWNPTVLEEGLRKALDRYRVHYR